MAQLTVLHINELHPKDAAPGMQWSQLLQEVVRLKKSLAAAQEELIMLTNERDELVAALRSWASDPDASVGDAA